jgi:transcriptional regulator with XRE-family HTH domain
MTDTDWAGRGELTSLLRACRARLARPAVPGSRGGGLRQEDVANLAGLSLRRYAALERGEFTPPASTVDQVAEALRMSEPERSALHVLATGQDPPRPVTGPEPEPPREPSQALRDMVTSMDLYPAALTDETWTLKHLNTAMNTWAAGWYENAPPADRHLVRYLFSDTAEGFLPDVHAVRRSAIAMLRYQYTRNLAAPGFTGIVARLTAGSEEAADLWARHEVAFPAHEYPCRVRTSAGTADAHVIFTPITPRLWMYTMIVPPGTRPPS